ncbi:hypothetical protein BC831DRAFT_451720 [Entophlyctis helioformis]|nr:hypothetical protein BC831DRAFT_451720 [Entophlyctis helioformis]
MEGSYSTVAWDTSASNGNGNASNAASSSGFAGLSSGMNGMIISSDQGPSGAGPSSLSSSSGAAHPRSSAASLPVVNRPSVIAVSVTDAQKHGEGSAAFVSYLVRTKTSLSSFKTAEAAVRRRFQDFVSLHKQLADTHPACILPPLPDKHRMEYITGDRFGPEFIEKRRLSLQAYTDRLARHPVHQSSAIFQRFLEAEQMSAYDNPKRESHVFESLGDVFLNAFAKVRKPDERFMEIKETVDKFEQNLVSIEKLHSKILKAQTDLATDFAEFGSAITSLGMMETQISQPLADFGNRSPAYSQTLKDKVNTEDIDYVSMLRDYSAYCQGVKDVLKARDQKQVDHEELTNWLQSHQSDRDRTMSTGKSPGIAGFFKDKINDLKGVDPEKARQIRLVKLDAKIQELQEAVAQSGVTAEAFSKEVTKEIDYFQQFKVHDLKQYLRHYIDAQIEFHEKGLEHWSDVMPIADSISLDAPSKSATMDET